MKIMTKFKEFLKKMRVLIRLKGIISSHHNFSTSLKLIPLKGLLHKSLTLNIIKANIYPLTLIKTKFRSISKVLESTFIKKGIRINGSQTNLLVVNLDKIINPSLVTWKISEISDFL